MVLPILGIWPPHPYCIGIDKSRKYFIFFLPFKDNFAFTIVINAHSDCIAGTSIFFLHQKYFRLNYGKEY